jgi:hypothetical protein
MEEERKNIRAYEYLCHIGEAKEYTQTYTESTSHLFVDNKLTIIDGSRLALMKILALSRKCQSSCAEVLFLPNWLVSSSLIVSEEFLRQVLPCTLEYCHN